MNKNDFYRGDSFDAYEYLGAHLEVNGAWFRTYAPNAKGVSVIGEFNDWQDTTMYMEENSGIYSIFIDSVEAGMMYKYRIWLNNGGVVEHCDPYGFGMELRPNFASIVRDMDAYKFNDEDYISKRNRCIDRPLNIYELHLGSWKRKLLEEKGDEYFGEWYNYTELAPLLTEYLLENDYNYVEFMPLSEHPVDESWGYQNTGFFSPTSRYGTCDDLKELIDKLHQAGIGVIMDFVPVHFAIDYYGLARYDGTELYEHPSSDVTLSEWGSCNFLHARGEVSSFLKSAANYWLDKYHVDGLRMDAISRIIYWQGEPARGVNGKALEFVKTMNEGLHNIHPQAILIAEDSTNYPKVTKELWEDGLGFDYKWDLGWMNDTLDYFKKTPAQRVDNYHKLTFSMMYYYNEKFLLPLSHDEVVHGKANILQKMYGAYEDKFPQGRAFYMYMYVHPGKKLNFMGNEIGQLREWDEKRGQDFDILVYPLHNGFYEYIKALNCIYLENDALYSYDFDPSKFRWIDCHEESRLIYAIRRDGKNSSMAAVFNFSDNEYETYNMPVEGPCSIKLILSSDWDIYGGNTKKKEVTVKAQKIHDQYVIQLKLPRYSGMLFMIL